MTQKKSLIFVAVFAVAGSAVIGGPTLARGLEGGRVGMSEEQKQKVEERKTAIKERVTAAKTERTAKLADKRLETCEKREDKINSIFEKATERNQKHLAVFQKIEERVKAFYESKDVSVEGYETAVLNADEKEAAAVAAIEASNEVSFDCAATDGAKPGAAIKEAMQARHTTLKDYRTAIKDLILVVKKHNGQNRDAASGTSEAGTDATSEMDTDTEATDGGAQ